MSLALTVFTHKNDRVLGVVADAYAPSTWEIESGVRGHPLLHSEFELAWTTQDCKSKTNDPF